jgi:glycolate oxidase FAD binding subunit
MVTQVRATTAQEIAEVLKESRTVKVVGTGFGEKWRRPVVADVELKIESAGVREHDVEDQVVVVSAGTSIEELQSVLREKGQCLPLGPNLSDGSRRLAEWQGTVAGQLSLNLPHSLQAACGSWRDWLLGLTLVRPDGRIAKCGSRAVKNVAGYDVQKLIVGARGTLGIVSEVILRTYPLRALPEADYVPGTETWSDAGIVQRTLRSEFEAAVEAYGNQVIASNPAARNLYLSCANFSEVLRFTDDWQLGWGLGLDNVLIKDPTVRRLMERTQMFMDPTHKLNPGEFF